MTVEEILIEIQSFNDDEETNIESIEHDGELLIFNTK